MSSSLKAQQNGAPMIHELEVVDCARLRSRDGSEMEKRLSNARAPGMFYLDLRDRGRGVSILREVDPIYRLAERYFAQLPAWKLEDVRADQKASQDRGYKQCGGDESFEIARDERLSGHMVQPTLFREKQAMLDGFSEACHEACLAMLACLSESLGSGQGFQTHHRSGEASDSGLKLVYEPWRHRAADVEDYTHTDSGTLTFMFYEELGIEAEIQRGGSADEWPFIPPKEGCAVINVADSLERMSGGALHSPVHRVGQPADGFKKRYYISYFLRPAHAWKDAQAA